MVQDALKKFSTQGLVSGGRAPILNVQTTIRNFRFALPTAPCGIINLGKGL